MNGNDWLLLVFYVLIAEFVAPHSCRTRYAVKNRCVAISVPNGKMQVRHRGRVGRFTCNSGYKLIGDKIATCHEGIWDTVAHCVKDIECPTEMPKVMNGKMVPFNYVYFKVSCNPGFRVPDGIQSIFPCEQFFDPEVKPPVCELTAEQFCDFETDMCRWNNTVPYFSWIRQQNATPSHALRTGPDGDHTYGTGHYLYIEASGLANNEEKFAKLVRRFWKVDTPEVCFVFWYHMYGFNIGTLDVYVDYVKVFTKTGNLGDKWRKGIIQKLPSDRDFYISMVATTGNGYAGDIAIDDIGLVNSTDCTKTLLIETSCKNRCFEFETNSTLCKCSSECLIESNCCPDFMQLCGADAPKSTASSETAESSYEASLSSQDVSYSTTELDYVSTSDESSPFYASSIDESGVTSGEPNGNSVTAEEVQGSSTQNPLVTGVHGSEIDDEQLEMTDSIIKITETPKPVSKHIIRSNDSDLVSTSAQILGVDSTSPPHTTNSMVSSLSYEVFTSQDDNSRTAVSGNGGTETWKQSSESIFHLGENNATTTHAPIASVTPEIFEVDPSSDVESTNSSMVTNYKPTTVSYRVTQSNESSQFTHSASEKYAKSSTIMSRVTVPSITLRPNQSTPTKMKIFTTSRITSTTVQHSTEAVKIIKTTLPSKKYVKITSSTKTTEATSTLSTKTTESTSTTVQQTNSTTAHPVTLHHTHFPSTVASKDTDEDIDESSEPEMFTLEPWEDFASRTTNYNAIKPTLGPYKRRMTYVPKGRYTFSAVKSESKTTTYVSVVAGILIFLSAVFVAGYVFRRRRSNLFRGSTEESDVLYMTSDEILDFNIARRPPCPGATAPSSSQQMLCQTEY